MGEEASKSNGMGKDAFKSNGTGKTCLSRAVRAKMRLSQTVDTRTDNVGWLKPYTIELKAKLSPTVGLNAGQLPYSLLKKMRATVKLDVFAYYFAVPPSRWP